MACRSNRRFIPPVYPAPFILGFYAGSTPVGVSSCFASASGGEAEIQDLVALYPRLPLLATLPGGSSAPRHAGGSFNPAQSWFFLESGSSVLIYSCPPCSIIVRRSGTREPTLPAANFRVGESQPHRGPPIPWCIGPRTW